MQQHNEPMRTVDTTIDPSTIQNIDQDQSHDAANRSVLTPDIDLHVNSSEGSMKDLLQVEVPTDINIQKDKKNSRLREN